MLKEGEISATHVLILHVGLNQYSKSYMQRVKSLYKKRKGNLQMDFLDLKE